MLEVARLKLFIVVQVNLPFILNVSHRLLCNQWDTQNKQNYNVSPGYEATLLAYRECCCLY